MVVLDATIVNIALPSAQKALHFSSSDREWIVTAYALAFGSLLLLGGKLGDIFGRKLTLIVGLVGFAGVSALGGLATSFFTLVTARAFQGAFGALLAPSALGLTAMIALRLLVNHRDPDPGGFDIPGLLAGSAGVFALVFGFSNAETQSWTASATIIALVASVLLLVSFRVIEGRAKHPLLPLHVVRDRARGGAYVSILVAAAGIFGVFFFLTFYLQQNLRFSPLTTGLAFLPMTAAIVVTSTTAQTKILPRTGAKPLVMIGMALGAIAMLLFTRLSPTSAYATRVLPGLLIIGVGLGCIFAPAIGTATLGVETNETGVASALVNTCQQIGGSIGLALLSTVSASAAANYAHHHVQLGGGVAAASAVHGYTTAFWWSVGIFGVGFVLALVILPPRSRPRVCTLKATLERGIAYAHHHRPAHAAPLTKVG
ncbi:MAG: MFS transporter [Actinobacteria bacterium]|nr:MAG: MFS transporter [Actinomycetota bacterium]